MFQKDIVVLVVPNVAKTIKVVKLSALSLQFTSISNDWLRYYLPWLASMNVWTLSKKDCMCVCQLQGTLFSYRFTESGHLSDLGKNIFIYEGHLLTV